MFSITSSDVFSVVSLV